MTARREGFALLAVLWIMAGASILATATTLDGRGAVDAARNRINDTRSYWLAHDCMQRARATIDGALSAVQPGESGADTWRILDQIIATTPVPGCTWSLKSAGSRLDVNAASREQLSALFQVMELGNAEALADAVIDWRDHRLLANINELARVRGFAALATFDTVLDVEPGRISIANAPISVLASVPGFTDELLAQIAQRRAASKQISNLLSLEATLSASARDSLIRHYDEVTRLTTVDPEAWIVTARGSAGTPPISVTVESRIVRAGLHASVVRHRIWR